MRFPGKTKRSHTDIWNYLKNGMGDRWDACRHEDMVGTGVPDISFGLGRVNGWIEMKSVSYWPVRSHKLSDLTFQQVRWHEDRGAKGGSCWVLVSVGVDYLLLSFKDIRRLYKEGLPNKEGIVGRGYLWQSRIDFNQFETILKRGC